MKSKKKAVVKTIADQIADILRNDIFSGKLLSGSRIKENEICEILNVSRTPVREAFRILESDGLVEINPNKGVHIPAVKKDDLDEVYELRILLEVHCLRKFLNKMDEDDLQQLEDLLKKMGSSFNQQDYQSYFNSCTDFHDYYLSNCQNKRIYSIFSRSRDIMIVRWVETNLNKKEEFYRRSLNIHKRIMEAIRQRDADKSEKLLRGLLEGNWETLRKDFGKIEKRKEHSE